MLKLTTLVLILAHLCSSDYVDTWVVRLKGGPEVAGSMARKHGYVYLGQVLPDYHEFHHPRVAKRSIRASPDHARTLAEDPDVLWLEQQQVNTRVKRMSLHPPRPFNDPRWHSQWYLNRGGGLDINVQGAWDQGYAGEGVVVTILDDGIEKNHPELEQNYDPDASYDVNGRDPDPQPRYDPMDTNKHGTRCAGAVAAQADNNDCIVGVAYNASIGGVRMLDGTITDAVEAYSLGHNPQHIDIYSSSWGPNDDGRTLDGPRPLAKLAIERGIKYGRGGKGNIFVWASGNGGMFHDSCACDGYSNSIHTISVSSATEEGEVPWYTEPCASVLTCTYSSGRGRDKQIASVDLHGGCTNSFTGTSASAPLAAGVSALALSANPSLTWRDLQHIIVMTSNPDNLRSRDWTTNGRGRKVSHSFGYGVMDAGAMVMLAKNWVNVPEQHKCVIQGEGQIKVSFFGNGQSVIASDGCVNSERDVRFLEHVEAVVDLGASVRGAVEIHLRSPQGTVSHLLPRRQRDRSRSGFDNWTFMSVHHWGESSLGNWTLSIDTWGANATLRKWTLILYGTVMDPVASTG